MNCPKCQTALRERERDIGGGELVVMTSARPAAASGWTKASWSG
jgi:hypothetical protein